MKIIDRLKCRVNGHVPDGEVYRDIEMMIKSAADLLPQYYTCDILITKCSRCGKPLGREVLRKRQSNCR